MAARPSGKSVQAGTRPDMFSHLECLSGNEIHFFLLYIIAIIIVKVKILPCQFHLYSQLVQPPRKRGRGFTTPPRLFSGIAACTFGSYWDLFDTGFA